MGAVPGFGDPQVFSNGADGSHAASHSEWAAVDVPAGGAERDTASMAAFASAPDHSAIASGWQHQASTGVGGEQPPAVDGAAANFSSAAAAGYGDAWGAASRGGGDDTAAMPWQLPAEPGLAGDTGTSAQAPFAHADGTVDAAQVPPHGGMSFGGGGYGASPLQLSPPSVLDPAAAYGSAEAGASLNEWQPGVGPGTGSAAIAEDEMVELDF